MKLEKMVLNPDGKTGYADVSENEMLVRSHNGGKTEKFQNTVHWFLRNHLADKLPYVNYMKSDQREGWEIVDRSAITRVEFTYEASLRDKAFYNREQRKKNNFRTKRLTQET